jgi:hypothetical protein
MISLNLSFSSSDCMGIFEMNNNFVEPSTPSRHKKTKKTKQGKKKSRLE